MAWYNSGNWDGVRLDAFKNIMAQLCYAVNEREAIQGRTLTQWKYGTGASTKTYPAAADFEGTPNTATVIQYNGQTIQTAIETLLTENTWGTDSQINSAFVDDSAYTTLTISDVLSAGSYGSSWLTVDRTCNLSVWDQMQEALSELTVIKHSMFPSESLSTRTHKTGSTWTACIADPGRSVSGCMVAWIRNSESSFEIYENATVVFETSLFSGTLINGLHHIRVKSFNSGPHTTATDGIEVWTAPIANIEFNVNTDRSNTWPNIGVDTSALYYIITAPLAGVTRQFDPLTIYGSGTTRSHAICDISGELTYG